MSTSVVVTAEEILQVLPHRFPFLLVDRVLELTEGRILAIKNVSWGEPYFQGHFPGFAVMPGVLQLEAMAQAGGILAAKTGAFDAKTQIVMFMAINNAKFRRPVKPGDQLAIEVTPLRKGRIWRMAGRAMVEGQLVSEAEFIATVADREP